MEMTFGPKTREFTRDREFGSFWPIFGVGRFGLSRCVVSALGRFGPISIGIEVVQGKDRGGVVGRVGWDWA